MYCFWLRTGFGVLTAGCRDIGLVSLIVPPPGLLKERSDAFFTEFYSIFVLSIFLTGFFLPEVRRPLLIGWVAFIRFEADICSFLLTICKSSFDVLITLLFMLFRPSFRLLLCGFEDMS